MIQISRILKRRYKNSREEFKKELEIRVKLNKALAMLIIETYTAHQHRKHIMQIWYFLGQNHKEVYKDYCNKLIGKTLAGSDDIWSSLYFADCKDLRDKYLRLIPEKKAMGDALAIAYKILRN